MEIADAIDKHAARLQDCYDKRTAGDSTFVGALVQFVLDVDPSLLTEKGN